MMMQSNGSFLPRHLSNTAASPQPTEETPKLTRSALSAALKPGEVVGQLNKFIVGQNDAKKAVAIALRNRWRRQQLSDELRNEVIPKNILMIGPTGCGKTEIARRIAKLSQAPFIKVEATKFTEVGFHGKDVDQIVRDLLDISIDMTKKRAKEEMRKKVSALVEERILDLFVGFHADEKQRESFRSLLRDNALEDRSVELEVPTKGQDNKSPTAFSFDGSPSNANAIASEIFKMSKLAAGGAKEKKKLTIAEARPIIEEQELEKLLEGYDIIKEAITTVEESGIVFIDEIDKLISSRDGGHSADASSEGVQRDLLPLIEGSTFSTKHGNVNTDFILFIASGAFHDAKPSDLLAELQGRLPIRVTLQGLTENDLYRILTEPVTNLIRQQIEMLKSENVELTFTDEGIREIARVAYETNRTVENIGARRLHTIIERVVEEISFTASDQEPGTKIEINGEYVRKRLSDMLVGTDLRKYIL